jgi:hypothetical protein
MKKTILAVTIVGALTTSAFSQGLVNFIGGLSNPTKQSTNSVVGGAATGRTTGAGAYYYALFASAANTTINGNSSAISGVNANYVFNNLAGWTLVGFGANSATAGAFTATSQGTTDGNQGAVNADGSLSVSGISATAQFVIVGWSANIGTTLASLESWYANPSVNGFVGQSAISGALTLGNGGLIQTPQAMGTAPSVSGFLLGEVSGAPVPEPATMALAALGGASLLMLRRKK